MAKYLLPCPQCNHSEPVATTQAGQDRVCPKCRHPFEAPQLQVLKELPLAGGAVVEKVERQGVHRGLFVLGLSLILFGTITGFYLHRYANSLILELGDPAEFVIQAADELTPAKLMTAWLEMEENMELPEWAETPVMRYRTQGNILKKFAYGLWGLAGVGVVTWLASWVLKK